MTRDRFVGIEVHGVVGFAFARVVLQSAEFAAAFAPVEPGVFVLVTDGRRALSLGLRSVVWRALSSRSLTSA